MCKLGLCIYDESTLINGTIFIPTCENCPYYMTMDKENYYDIIYDSQWWESYMETEYAWEMDSGIYDPPVF